MPETLVVRHGVKPNPRQAEFSRICDTSPPQSHIGYGGSIRAGKSQAGAAKIVSWAYQHGGNYVVSRKTYRRLEDSTKAVFLKGDGGLPPAIPFDFFRTQMWDYQVGENQIVGEGQGGPFTIMFRSLEHPKEAIDLIKNITLAGYMIDQIEELDDDGYEELYDTFEGRLSHPNGPRKGIGISNPGPEDHWYYRRVVDEATRDSNAYYVHTTLHDNAMNLDPGYVAKMMQTEHTRPDWFARYILGKWGAFGGKRFKCWNPEIHLVDPFDVPPDWTVIEGLDYGWAHLMVYLAVCLDPWNRMTVLGEIAVKETPVSVVAQRIKEMRERYRYEPSATWLDPNAWTSRGQYASPAMEFMEHGIHVGEAQNDRLGGWNRIEELLTTICDDPDQPEDRSLARPQLCVMRGRAPQLVKELPNLRIKDGLDDVEKKNDDACLVAGTLVATERGDVPIEEVRVGDRVWTSAGLRTVTCWAKTGEDEPLTRVEFEDGRVLRATANHPVWIHSHGFRQVRDLESGAWAVSRPASASSEWSRSSSMESCTAATPTPRTHPLASTSALAASVPRSSRFIERSGRRLTGLFRRAITFTIATATPATTTSRTSNASPLARTSPSTESASRRPSSRLSIAHDRLRPRGIAPTKGEHGIASMVAGYSRNGSQRPASASGAENRSRRFGQRWRATARTVARALLAVPLASTTRHGPARFAAPSSSSTATRGCVPALVRVARLSDGGRGAVYDLTVAGAHEFFANGVLVSNSDALRYIVNSYTVPPPVKPKARDEEYLERRLKQARGEEDEEYDGLLIR